MYSSDLAARPLAALRLARRALGVSAVVTKSAAHGREVWNSVADEGEELVREIARRLVDTFAPDWKGYRSFDAGGISAVLAGGDGAQSMPPFVSALVVRPPEGGGETAFAFSDRERGWSDEDIDMLHDLLASARADGPETSDSVVHDWKQHAEVSPHAVSVSLRDRLVYVNRAYSKLVGATSPEQVIGRSITKYLRPDQAHKYLEHVDHLAESDEPDSQIVLEITGLDGSTRFVEVISAPIVFNGEQAIRSVLRDITAQKQMERELAQREYQYRMVAVATDDIMWDWDLDTDWITWNTALGIRFGYAEQAIEGTDDAWRRARIHPDDRDKVDAAINAVVTDGATRWKEEYRFQRSDGSYAVVLDRGYAIRNDRGECLRIVGAISDLTEDVEVRTRLHDSEKRWRKLVENHPDAVAVVDEERILYANKRSADLVGAASVNDLIGRSVYQHFPADIRERLRSIIGADEDQPVPPFEFALNVPCVPLRRVELHAVPLTYDEHDAVLVVIRDIEDRWAYEQGLIEARRQAEEMARLRSVFLNNISHEIRTPLTTIIGFADILHGSATGEMREMAEMIQNGGQRLLATLNSVLDLAQLEGGAMELQPIPMDVVEELRAVSENSEMEARRKGLKFVFDRPAAAVPAVLDRRSLHRVVTNLMSNAVKFTDSGEIRLSLTSTEDDVTISVVDTGSGISEEFIPNIFDEFQQESGGLTRTHEGTGLGLTIVSRLVDLMKGRIEVSSKPAEGTTFTVTLPRNVRESTGVKQNEDADARRRNILIVDDAADTRKLLRALLRKDHEVHDAATARDAMARVEREQYDAILLDINLESGTGGPEVLEEIRKVEGYHETPVVAVTAYALPGDRTRLLRSGFDDYLGKPFTRQQLREVLDRVFIR